MYNRIEFFHIKKNHRVTQYYQSFSDFDKAHKWYRARPKRYRDVSAYDEEGKPCNAALNWEITKWLNVPAE